MKKYTAVFLITLAAVMASALASRCHAFAVDCDWPCLQDKVKGGVLTHEQAIKDAGEFAAAVKKSQELNKAGEFFKALKTTPIYWCKAWYSLNYLRQVMGGTRDGDGHWSGFKVKYEPDGDGKYVALYDGENADECIEIAKIVQQYIVMANAATIKAPDGENSMDHCQIYLDRLVLMLRDGLKE